MMNKCADQLIRANVFLLVQKAVLPTKRLSYHVPSLVCFKDFNCYIKVISFLTLRSLDIHMS